MIDFDTWLEDQMWPVQEIAKVESHRAAMHKAYNSARDMQQERIYKLETFLKACGDCTSADELHDFFVNNFDKVVDYE